MKTRVGKRRFSGSEMSGRPCMRPRVNMNFKISETNGGGGMAALGFEADQIRTLVSAFIGL